MEKILYAFEEGFGYDILLWFQSWRSDFVAWLFAPFNYIGTEFFFIGVIAVLYWLVNKKLAQRVSLIFLFTMWVNAFFKAWWKRPRPYMTTVEGKTQATHFHKFARLDSYGLPSGHTMSVTSFFGYLACDTKKLALRIFYIFLIIVMPISRLLHGFHYLQDVLVGLLLTILMLLIYRKIEVKIFENIKNLSIWKTILLTVLVCALLLASSFFIKVEHHSFKELVSLNAIFNLGIIGFILETKLLNFSEKGLWWKKILRLVVGFAGVLVIFLGLKFAFSFADNTKILFFVLRYIRYGLLGFWVTFGAPWIFVKFKLSQKEESEV